MVGEDREVVLVTGASRGIGRAIALRLAERYDLVAVSRSAQGLESLAVAVEAAGGRCDSWQLDVTDADCVRETLSGKRVDVLVNNAGVATLEPFVELSAAEWHNMVDTNLTALFHVTRAVLPGMVARGSGHVVTVGSLAGRNAFVGGTCYAATKHAVMGFSESLMLEVRDAGVKVSVIMPGSVATELFPAGTDTSWMLTPEQVAESVAHIVMSPPNVLVSRLEIRPAFPPKKQR